MTDLLQFFAYEHLPPHLQAASKPFGDLARELAATLPANAQRDAALQRLLEAKDCAVRAVLFKPAGVNQVRPTPAQIKHLVDRFLMWRFPETVNPDGGITIDRSCRPVGTNLLSATEADAMVRHMFEGLTD